MTDGSKQAWNEVGERLTSLGKRVADNYRSGEPETPPAREPQRNVEEVVREIGNQLGRAFDALDETVRDEGARRELKGAFTALGTAISATVDDATGAIRGTPSSTQDPPRPDDAGT